MFAETNIEGRFCLWQNSLRIEYSDSELLQTSADCGPVHDPVDGFNAFPHVHPQI
jgi:hypothetical protein